MFLLCGIRALCCVDYKSKPGHLYPKGSLSAVLLKFLRWACHLCVCVWGGGGGGGHFYHLHFKYMYVCLQRSFFFFLSVHVRNYQDLGEI